jgi:copper chaperone CopZ
MKRILIFVMAILPMAFCLSTMQAKPNKQTVVLYVDLHCQDCCDKILKNIPFDKDLKNGVKDLVFDLEAKTVVVTYDANKTDVATIQKAFAKIGKPATTQSQKCCSSQKCSTDTKCSTEHKCEGHHHHAEGEHHHH